MTQRSAYAHLSGSDRANISFCPFLPCRPNANSSFNAFGWTREFFKSFYKIRHLYMFRESAPLCNDASDIYSLFNLNIQTTCYVERSVFGAPFLFFILVLFLLVLLGASYEIFGNQVSLIYCDIVQMPLNTTKLDLRQESIL